MGLAYPDQLAARELGSDALQSFDKRVMLDCLNLFEELHEQDDYDSDILHYYITFIERRLHTLFGPNWMEKD